MNAPVAPFKLFQSVAIFGSADIAETSEIYTLAFEIGKTLAQNGLEVVNGGGPGVMKAATEGAHAGGGKAFTVSFSPTDAPFFEGKSKGNGGDTDVEATNYPQRMFLLIQHSDAFVVLNGGTGTLSEWATVWLMAHIHYGMHKPFVLVGHFWHEIMDAICKNMYIAETERKVYRIVDSMDEVIPALMELENELIKVQAEATIPRPGQLQELEESA